MYQLTHTGTPAPDDDSFAFDELANMLRRRAILIVSVTAVITLIATLVILRLPPAYRADATVLLDPANAQVNDIRSVMTSRPTFQNADLIRSQTAILANPTLARAVIDRLHLTDNPLFLPKAASAWRYQMTVLGDRARDFGDRLLIFAESGVWQPESPQAAGATETPEQRLEAAVKLYTDSLQVTNDGRSYVVGIRFQAADPDLAALIANTHVQTYFDEQQRNKVSSIRFADQSINAQLESLAKKVRDSEDAAQAFRDRNRLVAASATGVSVVSQQLVELNAQLTTARAEVLEKQARLARLQDLKGTPGALESAPDIASSATYVALRDRYATLQQQQAELSERFGENHPTMIEVKAKLKDLQRQIDRQAQSSVREIQNGLATAQARAGALQRSLAQIEQRNIGQDATSIRLRELEREVASNRQVYETFLARYKEIAVQEAVQMPDGRVLSQATPPDAPAFPNRPLFVAIAFVVALILSVVIALMLGMMEKGYYYLHQIERSIGIPGLGLVPQMRSGWFRRKHPAIEVVENPGSLYSEKVHAVCNALIPPTGGTAPKVLLITSSLPREGKSTFALSLARSMAQRGQRVLLIDTDLRRTALGRMIGADSTRPGLIALLSGKVSLAFAVHTDPATPLRYLSAERRVANAQRHICSPAMAQVLEHARQSYDCVILDSPPIAAVSDALELGRHVDATVFVIRSGHTPRRVVRTAINRLRTSGANVVGAVLLQVDVRRAGTLTSGDFEYYLKQVRAYYDVR